MLSLDPDFLRSFLAISETGSYGAAARHVNKTQSTVSAQMKRLEEILGVTLFAKEGRRNVLSPAGQRLLEYARPIVRLNDETVSAFRPPDVSGTLRIGTSDDYAQAFLPPILKSFTRTYPAVELEIVTGEGWRLLELDQDEPFDALLLTAGRGDTGSEPLRQDRLHWIGPERLSPHTGPRLPLVLWGSGCPWRAKALAALAEAGRDWRLAYTSSNVPLLLASVRDGLGVTVGPRWYVGEGLRVLEDMDAAYPLGMDGIWAKTRPESASLPALSAFLDALRFHFRQEAQLEVA